VSTMTHPGADRPEAWTNKGPADLTAEQFSLIRVLALRFKPDPIPAIEDELGRYVGNASYHADERFGQLFVGGILWCHELMDEDRF
jgi:hypothetical protein